MKIAGKEYTPKYPIMSSVALEGATGRNIWDIMAEISKIKDAPVSMGLYVTVVWGSLLHQNKAITVEEVSDLFDHDDSDPLNACFIEAANALAESLARTMKGSKQEEAETEKN